MKYQSYLKPLSPINSLIKLCFGIESLFLPYIQSSILKILLASK